MAAVELETANPYLDEYIAAIGEDYDWRNPNWWERDRSRKRDDFSEDAVKADAERMIKRFGKFRNLRKVYAYAVPCDEALDAIATLSQIVEIGAGTGYWARLLSERGADVTCYDTFESHFDGGMHGLYFEVRKGGPEKLRLKSNAGRTLFLCWPPYGDSMANKCLANYRGDTLVYVGEGEGGCTADGKFHEALYADWTEGRCITIPQWDLIHDYCWIYRRK